MLEVRDLQVHYPINSGLFQKQVGAVKAVDHVSFSIPRGQTLGLVGESGCWKTSRYLPPTSSGLVSLL